MAWAKRGKQHCFYLCDSSSGKKRDVYLGNGAAASLGALVTEIRRRERLARRLAPPKPPNADEELREQVAVLTTELRRQVFEAMHAAGYHRHDRGPWRRRRE